MQQRICSGQRPALLVLCSARLRGMPTASPSTARGQLGPVPWEHTRGTTTPAHHPARPTSPLSRPAARAVPTPLTSHYCHRFAQEHAGTGLITEAGSLQTASWPAGEATGAAGSAAGLVPGLPVSVGHLKRCEHEASRSSQASSSSKSLPCSVFPLSAVYRHFPEVRRSAATCRAGICPAGIAGTVTLLFS